MTAFSINSALGKLAAATARRKAAADAHSASAAIRRLADGLDLLARGLWHVWRNRQYLTITKLANMALVNFQCRLKSERMIGMPYRMKIEPTNICNTHCQLCPTGQGLAGRAKGQMSLDRFKKLVDSLSRYLYTLDLSMWGDPLIVPDIFEMIGHAHRRGIWTYISSNLHAFKPGNGQAHALVASGLNMLTCSLHGASQGTYETYQPGKKLGVIVEKIRAIQAAKKELGSATPLIQLNFVVTAFNEHEQEAFQKLADDLGCKAVFSAPSLNLRLMQRDKNLVDVGLAADLKEKQAQRMATWLPKDQRYVIEPYKRFQQGKAPAGGNYNGRKIVDCQWLWKDSVINWDGSVSPCCGSWDADEDMGNILETPFRAIWNSKAYRMARRSFKRQAEAPTDYHNPCRTCPGLMI